MAAPCRSTEIPAEGASSSSAMQRKAAAALEGRENGLAAAVERSTQLLNLAKKATTRVDPSIKRMICKRCKAPLLPGLTSQARTKPFAPHVRIKQQRCLICYNTHRLPVPPLFGPLGKKKSKEARTRAAGNRSASLEVDVARERAHNATSLTSSSPPERSVGKLSQRARRRSARQRMKENSLKSSNIVKRGEKCQKKRATRSRRKGRSDDKEASEMSVTKRREKSSMHDDLARPDRLSASQKRFTSAANSLKLPPYNERMSRTRWAEALEKDTLNGHLLDEAQKEAIKDVRGNHVVAVGVGRGGILGQIEERS